MADRPCREGLFTTITQFSPPAPVLRAAGFGELAGGRLVFGAFGGSGDRKLL
ncbi:hypothetical protein QT971_23275 [Microcoleus sp. herbarium19]|uniref:hypothetical protein n=1 Tax=unclassified Microcoleus TaxID=2642155 RepID=UPI002FD0D908